MSDGGMRMSMRITEGKERQESCDCGTTKHNLIFVVSFTI
jgi:hypothetical protein